MGLCVCVVVVVVVVGGGGGVITNDSFLDRIVLYKAHCVQYTPEKQCTAHHVKMIYYHTLFGASILLKWPTVGV